MEGNVGREACLYGCGRVSLVRRAFWGRWVDGRLAVGALVPVVSCEKSSVSESNWGCCSGRDIGGGEADDGDFELGRVGVLKVGVGIAGVLEEPALGEFQLPLLKLLLVLVGSLTRWA